MNCKNCGAPIKADTTPAYEDKGPVTYWHHIRSVEMGSIWCYPKADQELQEFKLAAEPRLLWCDECHCNHEKPEDCPYSGTTIIGDEEYSNAPEITPLSDEELLEAQAADIEFERRQERLAEYNDL